MSDAKLTVAAFLTLTCISTLVVRDISNNECFNGANQIGNIKPEQVIAGNIFLTFKDLGLLGCVKQCLVRKKCQSFNYHFNKIACELNTINSSVTDAVMSSDQGSACSDIGSWPRRIAGSCQDHTCAGNSVCVETRKGFSCAIECPDPPAIRNGHILSQSTCHETGCVIKYNCSVGYVQSQAAVCGHDGSWSTFECVQGCGNPPLVNNAVLGTSGTSFIVGTVLNYKCMPPLVGLGKVQCRPDHTWSPTECIPIVRSCVDLKACNSRYTDCEYWLVPKAFVDKPAKIFCYNMKLEPREFITLPGENYVDYSNTTCEYKFEIRGCKSVKYEKFQITDIFNMQSNLDGLRDCTFTNISKPGVYVVFSSPFDCHASCGSPDARLFVIDTRNTGLMIDASQKWAGASTKGRVSFVNVTKTFSGRVIQGRCRALCSWCQPEKGTLTLVLDPDYLLDVVTATIPNCG